MKQKVKFFVLFAIIIFLYLLLHVYFTFLGGDEPAYALNAKMILKGKIPVIDFWSQNMDFHHFFFAGWMKIFGEDIIAIRMLAAVLIFFTNIFLIMLLDRMGVGISGILAGLAFLNFNYLFNTSAVVAKHYATSVPFFFYAYFLLIYNYLRENKTYVRKTWIYLFSGLFLAFAYNSRINLIAHIPIFLLLIYYINLDKKIKETLKLISIFIVGNIVGSSISVYQLFKVGLREFIFMKVLWRQDLPFFIELKFTDAYYYSHIRELFFSNWQNLILWSMSIILLIIIFKTAKYKNLKKYNVIAIFNFFIVAFGLLVYFQSGHFQMQYFSQFIPYLCINIVILLRHKKYLYDSMNIPRAVKTILTVMIVVILLSYSFLHIPNFFPFWNDKHRVNLNYKNINSCKEVGEYLKRKIGINNLILDPFGAVSFYSDNYNPIGMISGNCIAYSFSEKPELYEEDFLKKNKLITRHEINYLIENKSFKAIVISPYMNEIDRTNTREYYKKKEVINGYEIYFPLDIGDKLNLDVHAMERRIEGPIYKHPEQKHLSNISYKDIFISPITKYPEGKYVLNITASGKPDFPTHLQSTLTAYLIKPAQQKTKIGRFKLSTTVETFITNEFTIDSEDMFQIMLKKDTIITQTQVLQFDGVDDYVIIPFKTPLDLPEGTLEFWQVFEFDKSEQVSSQALINFYTTDGHKFEFANGLLGAPPEVRPHFWLVWRRPDQGAFHINIFNPTFNAGEWNHWAGIWKRSQDGDLHMEFYLNGEFAGRNTIPKVSVSSDSLSSIFFNRLEVGSMGNSWPFQGSIAEVRLYNKSLKTPQLMQISLKENSSFLVGYWKLLGNCSQIVRDLTENHNDGTLGKKESEGADDPRCEELEATVIIEGLTDWLKDLIIEKVW